MTNRIHRGRRRNGEPPPLLHHVKTGQAYSTLDGRHYYFGAYGSTEARDRYERFRTEWLALNAPLVAVARSGKPLANILPTYLAEIRGAVSEKELYAIGLTLATVTERFGFLRPDDFRSAQFKAVRADWIAKGHHKGTVAKETSRVRGWFKWMVENELVALETYGVLLAIRPAPNLPQNPPVEPVSLRDYARTIRLAPAMVRAIARVQLFGGPRPGETCRMRGDELHRSGHVKIGSRRFKIPGGVWVFMPTLKDDGKKKGTKKRTIYLFGPRVQAVLKPYLTDGYLFPPRKAQVARRVDRKKTPSQTARDAERAAGCSRFGNHYSTSGYYRALERAADKAGVDRWHPHRLRHTFTDKMEAATDILTVSTLLSHESPNTTLIYLQRKLSDAAAAAAKHG